MDRRTFLVSTGAAAAAGATHAGAASPKAHAPRARDGAELSLKAGLSPIFAAPYYRDLADRLGWSLAAMSSGRLSLKFNNALAPQPVGRADAATTSDELDVWFGAADEVTADIPAMAYFAGLPGEFGLGADLHRAWLGAAGGQMIWDEVTADYGFKPLMIGHTGRFAGSWSRFEPSLVTDFRDVTAAVSGVSAKIATRLGARPEPHLSADSAREGLEAGRIALAEPLLPLTAALAAGYGGGASVWLRDGFRPEGAMLTMMVRRATWESLSDPDRELLVTLAARVDSENAAEQRAHQALVAPHLRRAVGLRATGFSDVMAAAVNRIARDLLAESSARDAAAMRAHHAFMGFRAEATGLADPLGSHPATA